MNTDPKAMYLHTTEKVSYALSLLLKIPNDTVSLEHVRTVRRQLSDACGSLNHLERILKNIPEPKTGEAVEEETK